MWGFTLNKLVLRYPFQLFVVHVSFSSYITYNTMFCIDPPIDISLDPNHEAVLSLTATSI